MGVFANENKLGSKFWTFWKTVDSSSAEPKLLLVATFRERSSPSGKWLITSWSTKMGATPVYAWQFETCLTTMIDSAAMWTGMGKLTRIPGAKTIVEVKTGTNVRICYFWWKRSTWCGHDPKPQVRINFPQGCTFVACLIRNCSSYVHYDRDEERAAASRIMLMYCKSSWALLGNIFR